MQQNWHDLAVTCRPGLYEQDQSRRTEESLLDRDLTVGQIELMTRLPLGLVALALMTPTIAAQRPAIGNGVRPFVAVDTTVVALTHARVIDGTSASPKAVILASHARRSLGAGPSPLRRADRARHQPPPRAAGATVAHRPRPPRGAPLPPRRTRTRRRLPRSTRHTSGGSG